MSPTLQPIYGAWMARRRRIVLVLSASAVVAAAFGISISPDLRAAAILVSQATYGRFEAWRYQPTSEWRSAAWKKPDRKYRHAVLAHVANEIVSVGLPRHEVERLLGAPDHVDASGAWEYGVQRPGWRVIDFSGGGLRVEFDQRQNVIRVVKQECID